MPRAQDLEMDWHLKYLIIFNTESTILIGLDKESMIIAMNNQLAFF